MARLHSEDATKYRFAALGMGFFLTPRSSVLWRPRRVAVRFNAWFLSKPMSAADTDSATWDYIVSEYQALVGEYHWPFKPMLELAQELAVSAPAQLYPGMSHEHLGFSLVTDYPQCVQMPQVWISYLPQRSVFEVTSRESLSGPQTQVICQPHEVKSVAEKALALLLERKPELD